jgi:tetratricopeptide (TPR) repeat protein
MKRLVLLAVLAVASRAHAERDAKAVYADGEKLYAAGRYLDAAEKFRTAYGIDPDPAYLFNVAQAYRFGEDCAKSAEFYHQFLAKVPSPPNAAKIVAWADEQEACARQLAAAKPVTVPVAGRAKPAVVERPGHARLYAGITTAVVGVALSGLGAYELGRLGGIADRRGAAAAVCTSTNPCTAAEYGAIVKPYDDLASAKQRNGGIGLGVGGLAIATAIYLIATSFDDSEHPPVGVTATTTTAMVYGTWTF